MLRPQGPDPVTGTGLTQQLETPTPTCETRQGGGSRDKIAGGPGQLPPVPSSPTPRRVCPAPFPPASATTLPGRCGRKGLCRGSSRAQGSACAVSFTFKYLNDIKATLSLPDCGAPILS